MTDYIADLADWIVRRCSDADPCDHKPLGKYLGWRPAVTSRGAARYCDLCETIEDLTKAEFYAYFGRMPL